MPVLPAYRNQSVDLLCKNQLTGFSIRSKLAYNGLSFSSFSNTCFLLVYLNIYFEVVFFNCFVLMETTLVYEKDIGKVA